MNADRRPGVLPVDGHPAAPAARSRPACRTSSPSCRPPGSTSSSWRPRASARATPASWTCVDISLYVMTPEFGAASQLEKIDMLDFADVVAINKFERRGAEDARRDVARQLVRNRGRVRRRPGRTCRCSAPAPPGSTTTASPRSTGTCATCSPSDGLPVGSGCLARVDARRTSSVTARILPPGRGCGTCPRSPRPCATTTRETERLADAARRRQAPAGSPRRAGRRRRRPAAPRS